MTVENMREQIKSDLVIVGTIYDAQIDTAIRSALRQLRIRKFWFLETIANLTLASGSSSLALPDNFAAPEIFDLISGGSRFTDGDSFDFLSFEDLRAKYWTDNPIPTGTPVACAISNRTLYFSHIANQEYTIPSVYYAKDATEPQASDTSIWFDDGYDVVRSMAQYIFKRDSQGYTASEEDGSMVTNYMSALGRQHERFIGGR